MTRKQGFRLLPEGMRKCSNCHEIKSMDLFYTDNSRASGTSPRCKACINAHKKAQREDPTFDHLTTRRKWTEANRAKVREVYRKWAESNRERNNVVEARRRARKKALPDTLTLEEVTVIIETFDGKCAICDNDYAHLDHFIPIASGHGGTTKENTVPLCGPCNASKHARNPFVWAETLPEYERGRFDDLVTYLTVLNGIADVESYKAHVDQCFK